MSGVRNKCLFLFASLFISGCGGGEHYAPVADAANVLKRRSYHQPKVWVAEPRVRRQEVLASRTFAEPAEVINPALYPMPRSTPEWQWPTQGKIIRAFTSNSKGIDITNRLGEPIYAANAGKVVYSGSGIKGYGNLIIIKHQRAYMTTYAHNSRVYVKTGQSVAKGQKIAEMGKSGASKVKLYFQVRYHGRPVNPNTLF